MFTIIVLVMAVGFFVARYQEQRNQGVSFDDIDIFGTKGEKEPPVRMVEID